MNNKGKEFFSILEKTHIDSTYDKEALVERTSHISQWLACNTPSKLYRFLGSSDRNVEALKKDEVWGSRPSTFNDPYECMPCYDTDYIDRSLLQVLNLNNELCFIDAVKKGYQLPQMKLAPKELTDSILIMLNNPTFEENIKANHTMLVNNVTSWWRDAFKEIVHEFFDYFRCAQQDQYITCFSENRDETLMWAHYAESHKGFCLEYDWSENITLISGSYHNENNTLLAPVCYSDQRFDATSLLFSMIESKLQASLGIDMPTYIRDSLFSIKSLLVKSKDWSYEKEWRMFTFIPTSGKDDNYRVQTTHKPKALFMGAKMDDTIADRLQEICDQKKIPCYKMKQTYTSTTFTFEPIPYLEYKKLKNLGEHL